MHIRADRQAAQTYRNRCTSIFILCVRPIYVCTFSYTHIYLLIDVYLFFLHADLHTCTYPWEIKRSNGKTPYKGESSN